MNRHLRHSTHAQRDIDEIWYYTAKTYGVEKADEYIGLLCQAFSDIAENPVRPGSVARPDFGDQVRVYRIALSNDRSEIDIKSPRHVIIYTLAHANETFVLRILHDAMDFPSRLKD